jgi:hypothetical protein
MPVLSAPMAEVTAFMTSSGKRARFSIDPPYASVRMFTLSCRNWSIR